MGLDMFLSKKVYVGANYEHNQVTGSIALKSKGKDIKINLNKVSYIIKEVGYWRKANHIHNWFVENCQEGKDECQETYVSVEQLKELLNVCKQVIENNNLAEELLPTKGGFFFGGTEYDEYYFNYIKDTIEIIENALKEMNEFDSFYYSSSW